jgi:hypothetical protein
VDDDHVVIERRSLERWHDERWRLTCAIDDARIDRDELAETARAPGVANAHSAALTEAYRALSELLEVATSMAAVTL